jgi:hypothetical protein
LRKIVSLDKLEFKTIRRDGGFFHTITISVFNLKIHVAIESIDNNGYIHDITADILIKAHS